MENFEQLSNEQLLDVKGGHIQRECTEGCGCGEEIEWRKEDGIWFDDTIQ